MNRKRKTSYVVFYCRVGALHKRPNEFVTIAYSPLDAERQCWDWYTNNHPFDDIVIVETKVEKIERVI